MQCTYCTFVMADPPDAFCPNCGTATMPPGYGSATTPSRVSGLGTASAIMLGAVTLTQLSYALVRATSHDPTAIATVTAIVQIATIPVFLTWFYRVRRNAGLWAPQRHGQGWSIGAWFTPVAFLWFPFQILSDVWRTSQPDANGRRGSDALAKAWWACWVLAWITGFYLRHSTSTAPDGSPQQLTSFGIALGATEASNIVAAVAALLGLLVVARVTRMQESRLSV